jgi:3-deoxy-manno-octulosonate cytidylyltransferase (CMP-KDO synthetase)
MIEHVIKRVKLIVPEKDIFVATDNQIIMDHVANLNTKSILTSKSHENGTSRVAEAAEYLEYRYIIIVQADEILLMPDQLQVLIEKIETSSEEITYNLVSKISDKDLDDVSVVKSLLAPDSQIIYLSRRNPLTGNDQEKEKFIKKNTGIFAFPKNILLRVKNLPDTPIQKSESIEQLKLIENMIQINGVYTDHSYPSINEEKDLENYELIIKTDKKQQAILKSIQ